VGDGVVIGIASGGYSLSLSSKKWVGLQNYSKSWLEDIYNDIVVDERIVFVRTAA